MQVEIETLLARCEETIARLKDDLRLQERVRDWLLGIKGCPPMTQGEAANNGNGGHRPAGTIVAGSLISHITEVLREAGREMRAREIAERVQARGYQTSAKAGLTVAVSSVLAHKQGKLFRKVSSGVYTLMEGSVATQ